MISQTYEGNCCTMTWFDLTINILCYLLIIWDLLPKFYFTQSIYQCYFPIFIYCSPSQWCDKKKMHPEHHYSVENACCKPMLLRTTSWFLLSPMKVRKKCLPQHAPKLSWSIRNVGRIQLYLCDSGSQATKYGLMTQKVAHQQPNNRTTRSATGLGLYPAIPEWKLCLPRQTFSLDLQLLQLFAKDKVFI